MGLEGALMASFSVIKKMKKKFTKGLMKNPEGKGQPLILKLSHNCAEITYISSPLLIVILYFFIFRIRASRVMPSASAEVC